MEKNSDLLMKIVHSLHIGLRLQTQPLHCLILCDFDTGEVKGHVSNVQKMPNVIIHNCETEMTKLDFSMPTQK